MAINAGCGVRVLSLDRQSVNAGPVALALGGMTTRAIHLRQRSVVVRMRRGHVAMATDAMIRGMDGRGEYRRVNEQGDLRAGCVGRGEVHAVAVKTAVIGQDRCGLGTGSQGKAQAAKAQTRKRDTFYVAHKATKQSVTDHPNRFMKIHRRPVRVWPELEGWQHQVIS